MKKLIIDMKHTLIMFCHTHATLMELCILMRDNYRRTPASRATYVVNLDRALVINQAKMDVA